jgi:TRAP-type transport system periplasmic protein
MKKFPVFKGMLVLALFLFFTVISEGGAAEKTITLRLANQLAPEHFMSVLLDEWAKDLEKRASGRVKVTNYHAATLTTAAQTYDAVAKGVADIANVVPGNTAGRFPLTEALELPVGFPNSATGTRIMNQFYEKFRPKEWDQVKILWLHSQGPGFICTSKKPIYKLEDLKGIKLRAYGGVVGFVRDIGATPVAMPMPEVYEALSKGIVDGVTSSYEVLESRRTGELINYVTENRLSSYSAAFTMAMNKRKWDSLPADVQKIMDQMSIEYIEKSGKAWDAADQSGLRFMEKRSAKKIALSPEEEQKWIEKGQKPFVDDYVKRMKEKGLPGEEALTFVKASLKR